MPTPRILHAPLAAALALALFPVVHAPPALAQDASSADIRLRFGDGGSRRLGEAEKNLAVDVLSRVTVHAEAREPLTVVLFVARLSGGRVVARGESAPFVLEAGAASSRGVPLSRLLPGDGLRGVAPLRPAEFVVIGRALARNPMNAAETVADPGPAFPLEAGKNGLFVAVVPADPQLRRRLATQALFLEVAVPGG